MVRTGHRVAIVLDPNYAERIGELARKSDVWVVTSASNDPVVTALWKDPAYSLGEFDVTRFDSLETAPEACFISILETVEDHHPEDMHDPEWSVIEVIGVDPTVAVRDELSSWGYRDIELSAEGFVVRRVAG